MAAIKKVTARQIFDSCGNPTVQAEVRLNDGTSARGAAPSGVSFGLTGALEVRDGGKDYMGKGVLKAVGNVNEIIGPALVGVDPTQQTAIDKCMVCQLDGTENWWGWCKEKLGANAILAVSIAVCRAGAHVKNVPLYKHIAEIAGNKKMVLPVPVFNLIDVKSHAENKFAIQEFMILPTGASSFKEAMKMGTEVYHNLKSVIEENYGQDAINVGDKGCFVLNIQENREGLELLETAIEKAGYTGKVMGVTASEYDMEKYDFYFKEEEKGEGLFGKTAIANAGYTGKIMYVGGSEVYMQKDGFKEESVEKDSKENTCNALLLKISQIGSVTESIKVMKMAKSAGWSAMASHVSGETEDTFIADLSVGLATGLIKTGAPCRSKHVAKYNQLLLIEEELGDEAVYAGAKFCAPVEPY